MSTTTYALPADSNGFARDLRIFATEIRYEVIRAMRTRTFSLATLGFPAMFYILFGLLMYRGDSLNGVLESKYLLGGYAVFGALGTSIFGIGVGVSMDLSAGWLELKRASPMPPLAYVLSKCCMAIVFSVIIVSLLTVMGLSFGHVHLTVGEFARIVGLAAAGAVPFSCLGMFLAFSVPPSSAGGIANLVYLPMSFLSGLWIPLRFLPHALQVIAPVFPTYHLAQLMYTSLGATDIPGTTTGHWFGLLGFTLIMMGLAWNAMYRREQNS
jgi:ABC-2 type transport system permease protein